MFSGYQIDLLKIPKWNTKLIKYYHFSLLGYYSKKFVDKDFKLKWF